MTEPLRPAERSVVEILSPRRTDRLWGLGRPTFEAPTSAAGVLLLLLRGDAARPPSAAPWRACGRPPTTTRGSPTFPRRPIRWTWLSRRPTPRPAASTSC